MESRIERMYVRIEEQEGFSVKGFRSRLVSNYDILEARTHLFNELEVTNMHPRVTYGVILTIQSDMISKEAYIAGVIGNSSANFIGMQEVLISSGRYVIASIGNETYDVFELLKSIREVDFFRFRHAPIVEKYIRNIESGGYDIELWVPIE